MTHPKLGERVLLIPQVCADLTNTHRPEANVIGKSPYTVGAFGSRAVDAAPSLSRKLNWPSWQVFTSTLVQKGYGVMVVRDGKLEVGPSDWDSGD